MILVRSLLFLLAAILFSFAMFMVCLPLLVFPRHPMVKVARGWTKGMLFLLKYVTGLSYEVRGRVDPSLGPVVIAAKHYTMWETMAVLEFVDDPAIVLKQNLMRIPFYGWYANKMEMIPVDRQGHASALRAMRDAARLAIAKGRSIVIFPEGTRRKLGAPPDYKPGVAALYRQANVTCIPAAHNSGKYWVAGGFIKRPGTIVFEFLEPIPPGLDRRAFMALLTERVETASAKLLRI